MQSLFKTIAIKSFSPEFWPALEKLQEHCVQESLERGLVSGAVDSFVAASRQDGFVEAVCLGCEYPSTPFFISENNLDFLAAYACENPDFDQFWIMVSEYFEAASPIELGEQIYRCGLTSIMRRIGFEDQSLRMLAMGSLLEVCLSSYSSKYIGHDPLVAAHSDLRLAMYGRFMDEHGPGRMLEEPEYRRLSCFALTGSLTSEVADGDLPELLNTVTRLFEPARRATPECLDRLVHLLIYDPMTITAGKGWSFEQIQEHLKPIADTLLKHYGYLAQDRRLLFRQMLVNGLSTYPRMALDLQASQDELLGKAPGLFGNPRTHDLVDTLSGPYGAFADASHRAESLRLSSDLGVVSVLDIFDLPLARTATGQQLDLICKPGDALVLESLLLHAEIDFDVFCDHQRAICHQIDSMGDGAFTRFIEYHMKSMVFRPGIMGLTVTESGQLLEKRPHLMAEAVETLADLNQRGVSSQRVSTVASRMKIDAQSLLNHSAFISNQLLEADMFSRDLGL